MRKELQNLLELLSTEEYHTAEELSEHLGISQKTVRTRLRELSDEGKAYGVSVSSRARYGYLLCEEQEGGVHRLLETADAGLPDNTESRTEYLLVYLLNHKEYTKIEDLCTFLCVSRSTLQSSIRETENILQKYGLSLDRRPNYGICAKGNEFDIRRCIGECLFRENMSGIGAKIYSEDEKRTLAAWIFELAEKYRITLSVSVYEDLVTQLYVAAKRIRNGSSIEFAEHDSREKYQREYQFAEELAERIGQWQQIQYTESEIRYIVIYLAGSRMVGGMDEERDNFIIREEFDRLVVEMLDLIYEEYGIEMRSDFNLRMALNQHMVPFDIRIRYQIRIANPILDQIQKNYIFGYTLAKRGMTVLEKHYGCRIPEEETGYFAMLFVYALEQKYNEPEKVRILIVCGAGRASSRLLKYKYEKEFGEYLKKVYVCGLHELAGFDFDKVEYVFTTVPISTRVPKPIVEVGQFLGTEDIVKVRSVLRRGQMDFLDDYYRKEQFFPEIEGGNREEVIQNICRKIREQRVLPDDFEEAVLKRETLAQTDFGNFVAMPHPYRIITEETFVYVAVLKKEIIWSSYPVRVVFLMSVSAEEDKNLSKFYEVTTSLFLQKEMLERIAEERSFDVMMQMLRKLYYMEKE